MPTLIGELEKITGSPSSVTQVMVRAHKTRITGAALTTDELVPIPVDRQGRFEVPLRPGKAVLVLVHGGRVGEGERFPMLVEEGLGTITSAIKLASDRFDDYELDELERAAADMLASLDKGLVAATRAEVAQEGAENAKKGSEDARDKAGEHRDDAKKAAGTAAAKAAEESVEKASEKLSGYISTAQGHVTAAQGHASDSAGSAIAAGKEADRAEAARQGAQAIEENLPTKVGEEVETQLPDELRTQLPDELALKLPGELDERVPPKVAEVIGEDRVIYDAAAAAVGEAADDIKWHHGSVSVDATSLDDLPDGVYGVAAAVVARNLGLPGSLGTIQLQRIVSGRTALYITQKTATQDLSVWATSLNSGVWSEWEKIFPAHNYDGEIPDGASVDDYRTPGKVWGVRSGRNISGLPVDVAGSLEVLSTGGREIQRFTTWEIIPQEFIRASTSTGWHEWSQSGAADKGGGGGTPGLKTVPLALTAGVGGDGATFGTFRTLVQVGAPISRWRLRIGNIHPRTGVSRGGFALGSVRVGAHAGGGALGQAQSLAASSVSVADGEQWVSPWVDGVDLTEEQVIEYDFSGAARTYLTLGTGWEVSASGATAVDRLPLWLWIEAETYSHTPVVALIGDSTGAGHGSDQPVHGAALAIAGRKHGFLPALYAHSGDTLEGNGDYDDDFNFQRWSHLDRPDSVIIQAGSNDIHGGHDVAELRRRFTNAVSVAHRLAPVVFGGTVKPRDPAHADYDENRVAYNAWLGSQPAGIRGVVDFSTAVAPEEVILDGYSADSAHLNAAGHSAMATALDGVTVARPELAARMARIDDKSDVGHKHGSADISEKTVSIGNPSDQFKMLYLDVSGRLRVDTASVTLERDVTSKGYVDSKAWAQGLVPTSVTSLDQLIDGLHSVANAGVAGSLGIPGRATGTLQMMTIANGRTAFYLSGGTEPALYINARSGGVWAGWKQVYPTTAGVDKAYVDAADQALGTRITNEKWKKTLVPTSAPGLDSLTDGIWGVGNGGVSRTLGIPGAPYGSLQIQTIATGRTAWFITQDAQPRVYVTAKVGGVWGEWEKVFPTDVPPQAKYAAGGLKTVPLALSTGISGDGVTSGRWRTLAHFGAPITRWRLHISNVSPVWGTSRGGFTLGEVTVGAHTGDGQMTTTRVLNAGARQVADGDEWVSEWVTGIDLQDEHLIDFAFDGATSTYLALGTGWDMSTGTPTPTDRMALWTWLEAETYEQTPTVALIGDSTGAGVGADRPVYESPLAIVGRERGFLPILYAHSGDTLEGNPGIEDFNFQRWREFAAPDSIIIQAGSNDLHAAGADLAEMQRRYAATAEAAHQIAPVVIGATVKPRFPNHPEYDGNRVAFNEWLQTQPEGIRDVLQFDAVLAPDGTLPAELNADGSHINTAGYLKMAEAFEGITLSRPAYNPDPGQAGEFDTGWRSLTPLNGEGRVLIRRVGKHVTVSIQDWQSEGEYAVHIALLPNGFRPTGKKFFMAASHTWAFKPSIIGMYSGSYVSWLRAVDGTYTRPTAPQSGEITFLTDDPEPTIYPGTPA